MRGRARNVCLLRLLDFRSCLLPSALRDGAARALHAPGGSTMSPDDGPTTAAGAVWFRLKITCRQTVRVSDVRWHPQPSATRTNRRHARVLRLHGVNIARAAGLWLAL
jgi:hypothetical protein